MGQNRSSQICALIALAVLAFAHCQSYAQQQKQHQQHQQRQHQSQTTKAERNGRAAHERPSCQTAFAASQRRRLATDTPSLLTLINDTGDVHKEQSHRVNLSLININESEQEQQQQQQQQQLLGRSKPSRLNSSERLFQLRQLLKSNNYDAYLVTPNDEHGSEYVADYDRRLRFITGFTGSNGFALITLDRAILFTDGRYGLQAETELDCNWALHVSSEPLMELYTWLASHVRQMRGLRVALDARLMSLQEFDYLDERLRKLEANFEFALISLDLIDIVWANLRAETSRDPPRGPLTIQPLEYAGQISWQEKVLRLVDQMRAMNARHYVISKLDDLAWLLNLRGSDIPMSPLFKAYLLVSRYPAPITTSGLPMSPPPSPPPSPPALPQQSQSQSSPVDGLAAQLTGAAGLAPPPDDQNEQASLLAGGQTGSSKMLYQSSGDLLTLQAPQVLQVPTSQVIKLTLYVDLRKVTQQVRDHLRLDNATGLSGEHHTASQELTGGLVGSGLATGSRIRVELRDYDIFYMDLRARFSSSNLSAPTSLPIALLHTSTLGSASGGSASVSSSAGAGAGSGSLPVQVAQLLAGNQDNNNNQNNHNKLLLDAMANVAIHVLAKNYEEGARLVLIEPLLQQLKSVKSELEVEGMRQAHWRDSLAIAMLLGQLEYDIGARKRTDKWTEVSAARELEYYRSLMELNRGQSFDTISAYAANAAIVHYKPNPEAPPGEQIVIGNQSTYLIDSGGQYLDGTTDITRTLHFGAPTEFQRETYTRVLMGAIDMMSLIFEQLPAGSSKAAYRLNDLLARRHLFELGLDYEHGTGHGIGAYSMVHEDPPLIEHFGRTCSSLSAGGGGGGGGLGSSQQQQQQVIVVNEPQPVRENMFTSVEPGFYRAGEFGIRLENIVVTQRVQMRNDNSSILSGQIKQRDWLRFEPISLVPFEPKLMKLELMSNKQKAWLNSYNLMVRLRMTQQINHYLAKLRTNWHTSFSSSSSLSSSIATATATATATAAAAATAGAANSQTSSGSRIYRILSLQPRASNGTTTSSTSGGGGTIKADLPTQRIEPLKFQQLLEQAHRWIMAKTELIGLDVPQAAVVASNHWPPPRKGGVAQQVNPVAAGAAAAASAADPLVAATTQQQQQQQQQHQMEKQSGRKRQGDDQWSSLGTDVEGQRLMLAYMSSLPFNDADAARAVATLASRASVANELAHNLNNSINEKNFASNHNKNPQTPAPHFPSSDSSLSPLGQKCSGIECDLLLLEALNSHQQQHHHQHHHQQQHQQQQRSHSSRRHSSGSASSLALDDNTQGHLYDIDSERDQGPEIGGPGQMLMDLFQLSTSGARQTDWWSLASMWPLLGLAAILVLQLAVMAYVCSGSSTSSGSTSGSGSASNSSSGSRLRASSSSSRLPQRKQYTGGALSRALSSASVASLSRARPLANSATAHVQQEPAHQLQPIIITESV